nr:uncharacterized protein LOC101883645 isoform X2 [Danio rerio]|eukprot:XP_021325226.1 uncharacterized protein LOC101883645 isoform X2 [Danio rerio]
MHLKLVCHPPLNEKEEEEEEEEGAKRNTSKRTEIHSNMDYVLRTVMFALVICGVFSADEVKVKSVMEGDSVTLNPDITQIQRINQIKWMFQKKGSNAAENIRNVEILQGRLEKNDLTGSLTINNMRTKHSGLYTLEIDHDNGTNNASFNVTVNEVPSVIEAHKAEIKILTVKKGEPLFLETDVTEFHGDELIVWRFGDEGKLLAKEDKETKSSPYYNADERYKGRLQLNDQTGFLTLDKMKDTDAGYYTVRISSNKQTTYKKFAVNFTGSVVSPSAGAIIALLLVIAVVAGLGVLYYRRKISELQEHVVGTLKFTEGESVYLHTGLTKLLKEDLILWKLEPKNALIAKINGTEDQRKQTPYYPESEAFKGRLHLNDKTGDLTITNTKSSSSGVYELQINSSNKVSYKKFNILVWPVNTLNYTVGDSATLQTGVTELKNDARILWKFSDTYIFIAELSGATNHHKLYDGPDGRFRDRLQINQRTGDLTIGNISRAHSDIYTLEITSGKNITCRRFMVVVHDKTISGEVGDSITLAPETEMQVGDLIMWMFGPEDRLIAKGEMNAQGFCTQDDAVGNITLDQTGSLIITNSTTEHSGVYKLLVISIRETKHKRFRVAIHERKENVVVEMESMPLKN